MGPRTQLLVGHRGVGKTTLARRFKSLAPEWCVLDLDEELEKATGESVECLLARGEAEFRASEERVLRERLETARAPTLVALGAGYNGWLPKDARVAWVRRATDSSGRVFKDRPRLNLALSPYAEYLERFPERERRYRAWAHEELFLPEGDDVGLERLLLPESSLSIPFDLTLLPENFRDWTAFWDKRQHWNLRRLELRDDWLSPTEVARVAERVPPEKLIYACRKGIVAPSGLAIDWPVELGPPPQAHVSILSQHERGEILDFSRLNSGRADILKLAVEIRDFRELQAGHQWWLGDPGRRAFLPRSPNGRWRWYRSLFGPRMPLHYIREGDGSSLDQPFLWQALAQPRLDSRFAAVLGSPVEHSRSPMEHRDFFKLRGMPFVAVAMRESEMEEGLPILAAMGLSCAAVTAPLKAAAFALSTTHTPEARTLGSVNTLFLENSSWSGHNTDVGALMSLGGEHPAREVWIWGGGGVKSSLRQVWPRAREFSAREGSPASGKPDILIWAVGRSREFRFPATGVQPGLVLDLNYGEDSPGLEWAVQHGFSYQSGLRMFKLQAEAQRQWWREREGNS